MPIGPRRKLIECHKKWNFFFATKNRRQEDGKKMTEKKTEKYPLEPRLPRI